jgi:tetratricopeptide (TPR) repeat protein
VAVEMQTSESNNNKNRHTNNVTRYLFADLILDIQRGVLYRSCAVTQQEIAPAEISPLPKRSYDLLLTLVAGSPSLLSQEMLMKTVWANRVIGDETLKQRVKLLRKSINDSASSPIYIEAVRGRGYRMVPEVNCECIVPKPPAVMLDLSANDSYPNLAAQPLSKTWKNLSKLSSLLLFIIIAVNIYSYLNPQDSSKISSIKTESKKSPAYEHYLKGKEYYLRYRKIDNAIAIDFFSKAILLDHKFSLAYAGLSQAHSQQVFQFDGTDEDKNKAIDNAYLAITYNSQSAESYKALGSAYYISGWLSKSTDAYLKALTFSANNIDTLSNLGFIYSEQGKFTSALVNIQKALTHNPKHIVSMVHAGQTLQRIGEHKLAEKWYKKAIALQPDYLLAHYHLGQLQIERHQYQQAQRYFKRLLVIYKNHPLLIEGLADSYFYDHKIDIAKTLYLQIKKEGKNALSKANITLPLIATSINEQNALTLENAIKKRLNAGSDNALHSYYLAALYANTQQVSLSLRYLMQAVEQGAFLPYQIEESPIFSPIKASATFKKIITNLHQKQINEKKFIVMTFWQ